MNKLSDSQPKPSLFALLFKTIQVLLLSFVALVLLPFYALGNVIWYRPPNIPQSSQIRRFMRLAWTAEPPAPGLSWQARLWLTLSFFRQWLMIPILGVAWLLDELLYGRKLAETAVVAPFFVISGGRSGSTQITRYLEADPQITAPSLLHCMFPYLWLWKLAPRTIGRFFTPDKVRTRLKAMMPPELLERHEFDPFKADTFDGAFFSSRPNSLAFYLGPELSSQEFNFAKFAPQDHQQMADDFVKLVDRIGRKHLIHNQASQAETARFFIKGHFLCAADALAAYYPNATFLTLVREPTARLQSGINYLRVNPSDPAMGPPPWAWLSASLLQSESDYCRIEQAWYTQNDETRRCVVRFADFVADLERTMTHVYHCCLDQAQLPDHIPDTHPPRQRTNYKVNYSLAELGIDDTALRAELAEYVAWCQKKLEKNL